MVKEFKIDDWKGVEEDVRWNTMCWHCEKPMKKGNKYVTYGNGIYHMICFKKLGEKLLARWTLYKKNIKSKLNKLKPFNKEMIVESLEI